MTWLKHHYGPTEGPFGFPMPDAQAKALDAILQQNPDHDYQRCLVEKATTELLPGERADVSWISTETLDRQRDIVLSAGLDDSHFKANPIVTLNHNYARAPIGRSLWRKKVRDGDLRGIKAKTIYPKKPDDWPEPVWLPDEAFGLIKAGLLQGKSIGFLTLESHPPTDDEVKKNPSWQSAWRIVTKWLLLEYSCTWLPVNQEAIVEAVSKGTTIPNDFLTEMGLPLASRERQRPEEPPGFTRLEGLAAMIDSRLKAIDPTPLVRRAVEEGWAKLQGRV